MNKQVFTGIFVLSGALLAAGNARASDDEEDRPLYGAHSGRLTLQLFHQSGTELGRTIPATAPATTPVEAGGYSRLGGGIGIDGGGFFDKTRFKTLVGFEGSAFFGYAKKPSYDKNPPATGPADDSGALILRTDGGPTYAFLHWKGGHVTFLPGMGLSLDGGRVYGSYAYFYVGARGSLSLGKDFDVSAQYVHVPGTTVSSKYIREHRLEAFANISSVSAGARLQLDSTESASDGKKTSHTTLTAIVGYAF